MTYGLGLAALGSKINTTPDTVEINSIIHSTVGGFKFPDGTVQTTAGGSGSGSLSGTLGTATGDDHVWYPGNMTYWSDGGTTLKIGQGTLASPSTDKNPPVWVQNYLGWDFSADAHHASAALFETIKVTGRNAPNALTGNIVVKGGFGGSVGIHGRAIADADTNGIHTGIWAATVTTTTTPVQSTYAGLEINLFNRYGNNSYMERKESGSLTALLIYNYAANPTTGANDIDRPNHFGIVLEGNRNNSFHTGILVEDFSGDALKIVSTRAANYGIKIGSEVANQITTGIGIISACGTGISLGENRMNMGTYFGNTFVNNDLWANGGKLYFRGNGVTFDLTSGGGGGGTSILGTPNTFTSTNVFTTGGDPAILTTEQRAVRIAYSSTPSGATGTVKSGLVIDAKAVSGTTSLEWGQITRMSNYASSGENVAIYGQGYKYSSGPTWAGVFETKDLTNGSSGALYGLEIDVWANGSGNDNRFGIGFNFGNATGGTKPTIDFGIDFAANANNRSNAQLKHGLRFGLDCTSAVITLNNSMVTPNLIDCRISNVSTLINMNSTAGMYVGNTTLGAFTGKLKIMIDGSTYYIPVYA